MSNKIYTANIFYNDGETIMHRGKLTNIGPSIFSFMQAEVGSIIELTRYSLNNNFLKSNKNIVLKEKPTIEIDTPFIVVNKLFVNEGCTKFELIEIKYLTKLELFDELYNE